MAIDPSTITVAQFQAQFFRDFPYFDAIQYDNTALYNTGDEVYYPTSKLFYQSLVDGQTGVNPAAGAAATPATWIKVVDNIDNYVQDQDITNAFAEALVLFNTALFTTDADTTLGFLYLAAHFLCNDLKAAMGGINGTGAFPMTSRTVGSVSEGYTVPQAYLDNPAYAQYMNSSYGAKYLMMILPRLIGNVVSVWGGTQA